MAEELEPIIPADVVESLDRFSELRSFGDELEELEKAKKRHEAQLRQKVKMERADIRSRFGSTIVDITRGISGEEFDRAAARVYWTVPDIAASWIAEAFGISPTRLAALAEAHPWPMGDPCLACGDQVFATARAALTQSHLWRGWRKGICADCWPGCRYCHRPLSETNDIDWYLQVIEQGIEAWHAGCEPKEAPLQQPRQKYADYLQSDHWRSVREWALERAQRRCQVCNTSERTLHVHHRTYERIGKERPEDLIALCDACHEIFHKEGKLA